MPSLTTRVTEKDIRIDNDRFFTLAAAANLSVVRSDVMPFELWNGIGFHLRKP